MIDIILVSNKSADEITDQIQDIADTTERDYPSFRIIPTCKDLSAAENRNDGLSFSDSNIVVMLDDDITGFYPGWLTDITEPLKDDDVILCSARLIEPDGTPGPQMGATDVPFDKGVHEVKRSSYKRYYKVTTAAIAFKKNCIRFDEEFLGCGYEDTDWCCRLSKAYPDKKMVINNRCRLVHLNEMKNQGGKYFKHNKAYYMKKHPEDTEVRNQTDWTKQNT